MPSELRRDQVQAVQQENCFGKAMSKRRSEEGASQHRKKNGPLPVIYLEKKYGSKREEEEASLSLYFCTLGCPA